MFKRVGFLVLAAAFAACGVAGQQAPSDALPADDELATTNSELVSSAAQSWLPMHEGNTWNFVAASGATRTVTFDSVFRGIGYFDGLIPNGAWLGYATPASTIAYAWDAEKGQWDDFVRFGSAVTSWSFGSGACSTFQAKRIATGTTITTPAGVFSDTRTIEYVVTPPPHVRCAMPPFFTLTFAANVGLVQFTAGNDTFNLQSAVVNGKPVPAAPTIKASLSLDRTAYTSTPNTIRCITAPCPSNEVTAVAQATYSVTNVGKTSQTWQFSSGCQFNVELFNQAGQSVKSLAETRFCTLALTSVTLAPGETKTWTTEVELEDRDGAQLDGAFTAKASLIPRLTAPRAEASASFAVAVKY